MAHLFPCEEAQAPPQPEKKTAVSKSRGEDNDDAEVIFVGVEHVKEDAETVFVRVISTSKPVISNVLNRVTRDSSSRRMKDHVNPDPSCTLQPANLRTRASEPAAVSPASQCVWWGRGSSIISEPSSKPDYKTSSLETVLHNSGLLSLRPPCLSGAVPSLGGKDESPLNSNWCPTSDVNFNSGNPKRPKLSHGIPGGPTSTTAPPGISPGKTWLWPWKIPWPHRAMFMVGHPFHRLTPMTRHASVLWIQKEHGVCHGWRKWTFWLLHVRARLLIPWK